METEGVVRSLEHSKQGLVVASLTTDRHPSIKKHMRTEEPAVKKKLSGASKSSTCKQLSSWVQPASNHLYWCAHASKGDGDLLVDIWKTMVNHAANIHEGHNGMLTRCLHKPLDNRSWLRKGSPVHKRLEEIATAPLLTRDIKQLSPHAQTFALESFHNVINQFAPKSLAFSYFGMQARTYIVILHFNENSSRLQATTKDGRLQWKLKALKAKAEEMIASPVMTQATFGEQFNECGPCGVAL
ncbi:uncharacterized protein LOC135373402 [Ornithodoros turicata]|uniref:uncharacterized protein LOC135373402 n=1 Tax=Ornithodoros turicata TaxID=34597 RepID=UPI00313A2A56